MKREIKFRALKDDMSDCTFKYGYLLYGSDGIPRIALDTGGLSYSCIKGTEGQFTGLKDNNGVEIYEGDIVQSKQHNPDSYIIEFIEGGFCATSEKVSGYPTDINHFYSSVGCCIKVIGNIYENKDLLK